MDTKYTEENLNSLKKEELVRLILSQQEALTGLDRNMQLVLEQLADLKRQRFGRSTERHVPDEQISFMEKDGKIVFFNEAEAVMDEGDAGDEGEKAVRRRPEKHRGQTGGRPKRPPGRKNRA